MAIEYRGIQAGTTGTLYESETLTYVFESDDHNDTIKDILSHPQCPKVHDKHPTFQWMFAAPNFQYAQQSGNEWIKWLVAIEYKLLNPPGSEREDPQPVPPPTASSPPDPIPTDPTIPDSADEELPDFDAHITIGFEDFTKPIGDAYTTTASQTRAFGDPITRGVPIVNSALEPYDPPPIINEVNPIIDIRKNVLTTNRILEELKDLNNSINIFGIEYRDGAYSLKIPPRCGRFRYTLQPVQEYNSGGVVLVYRELTIQVLLKLDSYLIRLLDIGSYKFSTTGTLTIRDRYDTDPPDFDWPTGSTPVPFTNENGEPHLRLLDGKGNELGAGVEPVYNEYKGYREQDFLPILKKVDSGKFFRS
jgi:hypothetical protein